MKKYKNIKYMIVVIICVILLALTLTIGLRIFLNILLYSDNNSNIVVSKNIVDNKYNNYALSHRQLIQSHDSLYYNYTNGDKTGTYKIDSTSSQKVFCGEDYSPKGLLYSILFPTTISITSCSDDVIMCEQGISSSCGSPSSWVTEGKIMTFMPIIKSYCTYYQLPKKEIDTLDTVTSFDIYNDNIYYYTVHEMYQVEENSLNKVCEFTGFLSEKADEINSYPQEHSPVRYITNDRIYCSNCDDDYEKFTVYSIDYSNNEETVLFDTNLPINTFAVNNNKVYFYSEIYPDNFCIYQVNLNGNKKPKKMFDNAHMFNIYDDKLYACTDNGLFVFDCNTGKTYCIYDQYAWDCYIFDSDWIYFVDYNQNLFRISTDGKILETVFNV